MEHEEAVQLDDEYDDNLEYDGESYGEEGDYDEEAEEVEDYESDVGGDEYDYDYDEEAEEGEAVELEIEDCSGFEEQEEILLEASDASDLIDLSTSVGELMNLTGGSTLDDIARDSFIVLTEKQVLREQVTQLNQILETLQLSAEELNNTNEQDSFYRKNILYDIVYNMMKAYQWNNEKLITEFVDRGEGYVLEKAGVPRDALSKFRSKDTSLSIQKTESDTCMVCFDDDKQLIQSGSCKHQYCSHCWYSYLESRIDDSITDSFIPCIDPKCASVLNQSFIYYVLKRGAADMPANSALSNRVLLKRYRKKRSDGYVSDSTHLRWCPSVPFCGHAIKLNDPTTTNHLIHVSCECGKIMCFNCGRTPHEPATCEMIENWEYRLHEDRATLFYLTIQARKCPKCKIAIDKISGCAHMNCYACRYQFCWECMGPLSGHTNVSCARDRLKFISEEHKLKQGVLHLEQEMEKIGIYFAYVNRYSKHRDWIDEERENAIHSRRLRYLIDDSELNGWITKLFSTLISLRQYLINCCVFAFYEFDLEHYQLNNLRAKILQFTLANQLAVNKETKALRKNVKHQRRMIVRIERQVKREAERKKKNLEIYRGLFHNVLDQLDSHLESIALEIEELFKVLTASRSSDHQAQIRSNKHKIDLLVQLALKSEQGIRDIICEKDMGKFDSA